MWREIDPANQINRFNNLNQKKMKKFYAILAASLVVGTASAASTRTIAKQTASLAPGAKEMVAKAHADIAAGIVGEDYSMKPSKVSQSGKEWTVRINNNSLKWCDMLVFGQEPNTIKYTFEEMPQYWVTLYTYDDNDDKPTRIYYDCVWPAQAVLDHYGEEAWYINFNEDDEIFNWEKAAQEYGSMEAAQAPASIESFAALLKSEESAIFQFPYGSLPAFYGLFNMQLMDQNSCTYQGTTGYWLKAGTRSAGSNSINMEGAAYLAIDAFDADVNDISFTMFAPMGPANATTHEVTVRGTVSDVITGETAAVFGFKDIDITPSEMHIFNLGAADDSYVMGTYNGQEYALGDIFEDFTPAQMYYVAWCTSPLTFEGAYGETELPTSVKSTSSTVTMDSYNWFTDYVTLVPNADPENTNPEGLATLIDWEVDNDGYITNAIEPGLMFTSYYLIKQGRPVLDTQIVVGTLSPNCSIQGWGQSPYPGDEEEGQVVCKFGFGDKTFGYNSRFCTGLGAVVNMKYTGDVKYHYDSTDYNVVKTIKAIGNADAGTVGVKTIAGVSDAETVATEYYNFQGLRLNEAPVKGMYIVREYKADGTVVAKKVAK